MNPLVASFLPHSLPTKLLRFFYLRTHKERFKDAVAHFLIEKGVSDNKVLRNYKNRLVRAFVKDNWYPDEFFFFNYEYLSRKGIHDFVPNREANLFWNYLNSREIYLLTCDKGRTYDFFRDYYHREVLAVYDSSVEVCNNFREFIDRHCRFIVKPNFGNYGNGVKILDSHSIPDADLLLKNLLSEYRGGFIAEELIVQSAGLSEFHPSSVNTVRLTTAKLSNGEIYIIHRPFLRIGQGGRCVDNGGNGGIICAIDYNTGIIKGAIDERMNRYVIHPDTGKTLLGYQIPSWEEAKELVIELASVLPDLNYCGWDLALTNEGWVMVEANGKGLFIGFQMPTQEGFREEFEELKKSCGYNK